MISNIRPFIFMVALTVGTAAACGDVSHNPPPSGMASTAGGGAMASESYRMDLWLGTPQPVGRAASTNHQADIRSNSPAVADMDR